MYTRHSPQRTCYEYLIFPPLGRFGHSHEAEFKADEYVGSLASYQLVAYVEDEQSTTLAAISYTEVTLLIHLIH